MRQNTYSKSIVKAIYRYSFISGADSILSLQGQSVYLSHFKRSVMPSYCADALALEGDWNRVGKQLEWATKSLTE